MQEQLPFDGLFKVLRPEEFDRLLKEFRTAVKKRKSFEDRKSNKFYHKYTQCRDEEMVIFCELTGYLKYFKPSEKLWREIMLDE